MKAFDGFFSVFSTKFAFLGRKLIYKIVIYPKGEGIWW